VARKGARGSGVAMGAVASLTPPPAAATPHLVASTTHVLRR
jgi:hypothetical protein